MRKTLFPWLSNGFVALSAEAQVGGTADEQARDVFDRFALELRSEGLSLADTVRTRLWARDRESRDGGSRERVAALAGDARSASSSYIAPAQQRRTAVDDESACENSTAHVVVMCGECVIAHSCPSPM